MIESDYYVECIWGPKCLPSGAQLSIRSCRSPMINPRGMSQFRSVSLTSENLTHPKTLKPATGLSLGSESRRYAEARGPCSI